MSVINTVKELFAETTQKSSRNVKTADSKGAYWCHDCSERILDLDVEGEEPPACPDCGDEMEFERSTDSAGCAC